MGVRAIDGIEKREIYALGYFYDRAAQANLINADDDDEPSAIRVGAYAEAAQRVCSQRGALFDGWNRRQPWQCLDLAYIYSLLHTGYGLSNEQLIRVCFILLFVSYKSHLVCRSF